MDKVAIIGAGISGLALANKLKNHFEVVVFEKSRGYGGRVATRRSGEFIFDHGAQFFKAKTEEFKNYINPMIDQNIIDVWKARFVEIDNGKITNDRVWGEDPSNYVGIPSMNAIGKYMADGLNVRLSEKVANVLKGNKWQLYDEANDNIGEFDWVISAIPPKQAIDMIPDVVNLYSEISRYEMLACYSLMLGYDYEVPEDVRIGPGQYYNPYMTGGVIAMPPQLQDGLVEYADGTEATKEQMATDVAAFLTWASEPHMEVRKKMGLMVMIYLLVLAGLLYAAYRQVWSNVKH